MFKYRICLLLTAIFLVNVLPQKGYANDMKTGLLIPIDLRCEHLINPLGIDDINPRLSWKLESTNPKKRNQYQTAYQIVAANSRSALEQKDFNLWNTGQIESDQSTLVPYNGKPLQSHLQCWWKVRVWDEDGNKSEWSQPVFWSMGLLNKKAWAGAKWIGLDEDDEVGIEITDIKNANWLWYPEGNAAVDAPVATRYFRHQITIPTDRKIKRALCFFAGDDVVFFYVNGASVGVGHAHPNLIGVDLTGKLKAGVNQLAVAVTNGNVNVPANPAGWIASIRVEFDKGDPLVIYSDKNWKSVKSTSEDWQTAGFTESEWVDAMELGKAGIAPWGIPWKDKWYSEHRRLSGRYVRHDFKIPDGKTVQRATAYTCGLGFFDLFVNGQPIGDQLMNPALTGYDKRALYVTYDITQNIQSGKNAIGVVLSNGRFFAPRLNNPVPMHSYGYPKMIGQIHLEFSDGTEQRIITDESWKINTNGPLRSSNEFDGEEYDARLEMADWNTSGFDDSKWRSVQLVKSPGGQLEAQMIEPIRVTETLKPVQLIQPKPGIWMVDFGQSFYGVVQLKVQGPVGTRITMRTSFNILPDGTLNYTNDRSAKNTDTYTLKGNGIETWNPKFHGNAMRWAQIEGFPGKPTKENFVGLVTHTDHEIVGEFACSNKLINRIYLNARWGTRMQNRSVPMEPDRDERMPWSGHPAKTSESEGWAFNVARFYEHFLHNYRVHQAEDGSMQEILPPYWLFNSKDIIWPSVATIIPDWYYNFYGDDRPIRDNYEMMKRFVMYHKQKNLKPDYTMDFCNYGDWVDTFSIGANRRNFGATSRPLMGTAYFYNNCRIVERAARILKKTNEEKKFGELADKVYNGFNKRFLDAKSGTYESKTQCSSILPLAFGLVPEKYRQAVVKSLVNDILITHKGHTSVGLIGTQWQMQVLTDIDHPEVAYKIATQTERPSWGYMISKGATTIWERWDTDTQDGGMNGESQKILSGNFEAWCYQTLGGINYDSNNPGFKHIILKPHPVDDLNWARASHKSAYGKIESDWKIKNDEILWRIKIPPNTTATAYIPTTMPDKVYESGRLISQTPDIVKRKPTETRLVVELGPGSYEFTAPFQK
jgi:alpha-L-rhamnosidase